jgi:hypothetical protein
MFGAGDQQIARIFDNLDQESVKHGGSRVRHRRTDEERPAGVGPTVAP